MHRFEPETRYDFIKDMHTRGLIASICVGVKDDEYSFIEKLADNQVEPDFITIDIAHGSSNAVLERLNISKSTYK